MNILYMYSSKYILYIYLRVCVCAFIYINDLETSVMNQAGYLGP